VCNFPERKDMNNYYKIFFSPFLIVPLLTMAQNFDPKTVVPKSLTKYSFGMPLYEFAQKNNSAQKRQSSSGARIEYEDKNPDKDIKNVTYYFDAGNDAPPLYEMIIVFNDVQKLNSYCSKTLGQPNEGKQWKRTTKDSYTFKAGVSAQPISALGLPGTEWEKTGIIEILARFAVGCAKDYKKN
jgi:hypothetical protein